MSEIVIRIVGKPGDGIISSGDILTLASARSGRYVSTYRSFPTEIRGVDQSLYQLRISSEKILTPADEVDVMVSFDEKFLRDNVSALKSGGVIIFDSSENSCKFEELGDYIKYFVPITTLAKEFSSERTKNMVALGILSALMPNLRINEQIIPDIRKKYETKGEEVISSNILAYEKAYNWARENISNSMLESLIIETSGKKLIMSGCEAMALGALVAGCRFYSGYPITPATEVMELLAKELPRLGGNVIQCEDEISAITTALGASFSGVKAMTATSGPGFSLMSEAIGLSSMAEIPIVIADVQRGGPSTGLPTKTEQSDLNLAIYGTHGDTPKIVLAPINVEDSFYQTVKAFNYAETYQVPVIILSDVSLGERRECIDAFDIEKIEVTNRAKPEKIEDSTEPFSRYARTYSGISPIPTPGQKGGAYIATGLEHTENSTPSSKPEVHAAMTEKRFKKLETAQTEFLAARKYGKDDARFGIISWGSTSGAVLEAIDLADKQGYSIQALYPRIIYPFPSKWINDFLANKDILLIVERNYSSQFANTIVYRCTSMNKDIQIYNLNKYNGEPFTTKEIYDKIDHIIKGQYLKFTVHQ